MHLDFGWTHKYSNSFAWLVDIFKIFIGLYCDFVKAALNLTMYL